MPIARSIVLLVLLAAMPALGAEVAVNVARHSEAFDVEASAEFAGTVARTWQVLTDYGRLAKFIPGMRVSRVVSRNGNQAVLEQMGETRVLFFSYNIDVRLAVTEYPYERVSSRALAGNFREMRGTYSLEAGQGRILLRYSGHLVPDFFVPPVIGTFALRRNIETSFRALVGEIERRQDEPATQDGR